MKSKVGQFVPDGITHCAQNEHLVCAKGAKDMRKTVWGVNDANVFIPSVYNFRLNTVVLKWAVGD